MRDGIDYRGISLLVLNLELLKCVSPNLAKLCSEATMILHYEILLYIYKFTNSSLTCLYFLCLYETLKTLQFHCIARVTLKLVRIYLTKSSEMHLAFGASHSTAFL